MTSAVRLLAKVAETPRFNLTMEIAQVMGVDPLVLNAGGPLEGGVKRLSSYSPSVGDYALMIRYGGLAVLIGKVV